MAQQVFPQWSPVVKAHNEDQQEVYIPAAIIHAQTRDGKDELIVGAANMQFDPETGDYLPTHAGNPVEVRARALETLLEGVKSAVDALAGTVDAGAQKVTLSGSVPVIWGANISERPAASEVPVGTQFILANENLDAWVSNGTDWVVI